jgi:hypothetical protein
LPLTTKAGKSYLQDDLPGKPSPTISDSYVRPMAGSTTESAFRFFRLSSPSSSATTPGAPAGMEIFGRFACVPLHIIPRLLVLHCLCSPSLSHAHCSAERLMAQSTWTSPWVLVQTRGLSFPSPSVGALSGRRATCAPRSTEWSASQKAALLEQECGTRLAWACRASLCSELPR